MRSRFLTPWAGIVAVAVLSVGCAEAPTVEIAAANEAIESARAAGAPEYAPQAWTAAQDASARLETELAVQEQKYAITRSYDEATKLAAAARDAGQAAVQQAADGKAQAKSEAESLVAEARQKLEQLEQDIASAPQGKGSHAEIASMRADSGNIQSYIAEAEAALAAGDYLVARTKARSAIESIERISGEIEQARELAKSA